MDENALKAPTSDLASEVKRKSEDLASDAKDALRTAATEASSVANTAYEQGEEFIRGARERYPEAERFYRDGGDALRSYAESPLVALVVGVGIGFVLSHLVRRIADGNREQVPDYARTR